MVNGIIMSNNSENISIDKILQMYSEAKKTNDYQFWIYTGLLAEILKQYHYSIDCYTNALKMQISPFLRTSLARAQAGVGQWEGSLKTLLSLSVSEFSSVISNYNLCLTIGFLPYNLQRKVTQHFKEQGLIVLDDIENLENALAVREEKYINQKYRDSSQLQIQTYIKFSKLLIGDFDPRRMTEFLQMGYTENIAQKILKTNPEAVETSILRKAKLKEHDREYQKLDRLDGWLTPLEGRVLAVLAENVEYNSVIVEIGSWKGKSSCFLGTGSSIGKKPLVFCIDPHNWTDNVEVANTFSSWTSTIEYLSLENLVINIRKESEHVARDFSENVGLLFVDGDHSRESLIIDIENWLPKLEKGAYIAFHDAYFPDVFEVLQERIFRSEKFRIVDFVEGLLIVQFSPNRNSTRTYSELVIWLYFIYKSQIFKKLEDKRVSELVNIALSYRENLQAGV